MVLRDAKTKLVRNSLERVYSASPWKPTPRITLLSLYNHTVSRGIRALGWHGITVTTNERSFISLLTL